MPLYNDRQHFNTGAGGYLFVLNMLTKATEKLNGFSRNAIVSPVLKNIPHAGRGE